MGSLAVLHGLLVTGTGRVVPDCGIYVEDGVIRFVGTAREVVEGFKYDEELDASNCVVIPGLIDSHRHLYGILTRGMPVEEAPKSFIGFLEDFWWPFVEDRLDREMIEAGAAASAVEALKTGTTTLVDILEAPYAIPGALEAEARALERLGVRAVLSFEATERVSPDNGEAGLRENEEFCRSHGEGLITGRMCIHTTFTCSPEFLREARRRATELGVGIHMHLEEGAYETMHSLVKYRKLPVRLYEEIGFLGPDVLAAQCVHTRPEEVEIMVKRGVKVSHEPLSNCEVGGGIARVPEMIEAGLTVGLGTDGYVTDMFEVMRAAFLMHKGRLMDPTVMPADLVFRMATIDNARAVGMDRLIGSVEPGKRADLVVLDYRPPTPLTPENVLAHLVTFCSGSRVRDVVVDGRIVVRGGELLTADEAEIRERAREEARRLWARG